MMWTNAGLEHFAKAGPKNEEVAKALRPLDPYIRGAVLEAAREIKLTMKGEWTDVVRWVAASTQAGADLGTLREIMAGRSWSTRRPARSTDQASSDQGGSDG